MSSCLPTSHVSESMQSDKNGASLRDKCSRSHTIADAVVRRYSLSNPHCILWHQVCILKRIIPHSMVYITTGEEGVSIRHGFRDPSEDQINSYLDNTLGRAPRPAWGCPDGWGAYLGGAPGAYAQALLCHCVRTSCIECGQASAAQHARMLCKATAAESDLWLQTCL